MRGLSLGASVLENLEVMNENMWLVPDHVNDHVDHLLFLMRNLVEVERRQVELVVGLKDIFKSWQCVDDMPVIVLTVFIDFHTRCAAAHTFASITSFFYSI